MKLFFFYTESTSENDGKFFAEVSTMTQISLVTTTVVKTFSWAYHTQSHDQNGADIGD